MGGYLLKVGLICIASDFTKYDSHAGQQINRTIELIRYNKFGGALLLLELVHAVDGTQAATVSEGTPASGGNELYIRLPCWRD